MLYDFSKQKYQIQTYLKSSNLKTDYPIEISEISDTLKEKIKESYCKNILHKGVSEVINQIDTQLDSGLVDKTIYLVGYLDIWYEKLLIKALSETQKNVKVLRISKDHASLVYECIKEINRDMSVRSKPRRSFKCRAFLL